MFADGSFVESTEGMIDGVNVGRVEEENDGVDVDLVGGTVG